MKRAGRTAGALVMLALLSSVVGRGTAVAQQTDGRWLAWLGCWKPVAEEVTPNIPDTMLCFQPVEGDVGVEMVTVRNGETTDRQTIRADRQRYESTQEGCTGWDRGDFSAQPARVFLTSEYACDGGVSRASTGLLAVVSPEEWIEVKVVTVAGGEPLTWVTRYRLATQGDAEAAGLGDIAADRDMAVRSARIAAARLSVDDVIEASGYVEAEGVSAWIAERNAPLELDADELVRMADGGVPEAVIDMVIAVTYPERFAVNRETEQADADYGPAYGSLGRYGHYRPFYSSLFFSPFGYYSPFGYSYGYSPYGYGRYGYGGYGYGGYGYGGYYVPVVVRGNDSESGGRVIRGQGYSSTRSSGARSGRQASPRGYFGGSSRGSVSGSSSRGQSGGTSTGRTAKRRGGGG